MSEKSIEPKRYCLNAGDVVPECEKSEDGCHDYVETSGRNCWHVNKCQKCGIIMEYDSSD